MLALPVAYPVLRWEVAGCWLVVLPLIGLVRHHRGLSYSSPPLLGVVLGGLLCVCGYGYGAFRIGQVLSAQVPNCADAQPRTFSMVLLEEPVRQQLAGKSSARFRARVTPEARDPDCPNLDQHQVRLTWYDPPGLIAGQVWKVTGKLRPAWGYRNPAGFDYERWLLGQRLHGTGYVSSGQLISTPAMTPVTDTRVRFKHWLDQQPLHHGPVMLALLMGDDSFISSEQWRWLRDSGTIHLVVVSGLHVGIVTGLLFFIALWSARLSPRLLLRVGVRRVASAAAIAGSSCYVLFTGGETPAIRAWLMSTALLVALSSGRRVSRLQVYFLVLGIVLLIDPLVVHQQGFWLSFIAVAALLAYFAPRPLTGSTRRGRWMALPLTQWVLLIAMSPLLASTQGAIPVLGPLVNLIVVPLVTMVILPLVMTGGILFLIVPETAAWVLRLADFGIHGLMFIIRGAASFAPMAVASPGLAGSVLMFLGVTGLLLAPGRSRILSAAALWLGLLIPHSRAPDFGELHLWALDVGQGTAIIVNTRQHRLIYDTGPGYPSGFNLGATAVVPSYFQQGFSPLDALILSHDDADHTGGAASVIEALQPRQVIASFNTGALPGISGVSRSRCRKGQGWVWDGVRFTFLHPADESNTSDNDGSCVLLIETASTRVLIAGDVSSRVERQLDVPPLDLLFAPHHGSKTSSSAPLVQATRPPLVFISTSRRSRYGHPHAEVLSRYRRVNASVFVTGTDGALSWYSQDPKQVTRSRTDQRAYWHRDGRGDR